MFAAGIDIGSLTAKTVILDDQVRVVGHALVLTGAMSKRAGETSFEAALKVARQPVWMAIFNPVLGAVEVLVGSSASRRRGGSAAFG